MTAPASSKLEPSTAPLTFTVIGTPAAQGNKRSYGGHIVETTKGHRAWRSDVKDAAMVARHQSSAMTLDGPLIVTAIFTLRKPKSAPKTRRTWPEKKPDIDKILRSTFDALTEAGVWGDDAQVVSVTACKRYTGDPGALDIPGAWLAIRGVTDEDVL